MKPSSMAVRHVEWALMIWDVLCHSLLGTFSQASGLPAVPSTNGIVVDSSCVFSLISKAK